MKSLTQNFKFPILFSVIAFIVLIIISIVNHLNFETFALDLGVYTNALYNYAHFNLATTSVFEEAPKLLLADHFDLYLIVFAPLVFVFGSYTLLIIQLSACLVGCIGLYKLLEELKVEQAHLAPLLLMTSFGVVSAFGFDYHSSVIAALLIPWLLFFLQKSFIKSFAILFLFILISKENTGIIIGAVMLGLSIDPKFKKQRQLIIISALVGAIYSICIIGVVMPILGESETYSNYKYAIGDSFFDLLKFTFTHPLHFIELLFGNHLPDSIFPIQSIKLEMIIFFLGAGGLLLIRRPWLLICFIPIFVQKFLHTNVNIIGIGSHYSIEIVVLLSIFCPIILNDIKQKIKPSISMVVLLIISCGFSVRLMDQTVNFIPKNRVRFYQSIHYSREDIQRKDIENALKQVPNAVSVSASSNLVPHLVCRKELYQFPILRNADYILYGAFDNQYPISKKESVSILDSLVESKKYSIVQKDKGLILLKNMEVI